MFSSNADLLNRLLYTSETTKYSELDQNRWSTLLDFMKYQEIDNNPLCIHAPKLYKSVDRLFISVKPI